jgi:hypothetical protein
MPFDADSIRRLNEDIERLTRMHRSIPLGQEMSPERQEARDIRKKLLDRLELLERNPKIDEATSSNIRRFRLSLEDPLSFYFEDEEAREDLYIDDYLEKWRSARKSLRDLIHKRGGSLEIQDDTIYDVMGTSVIVSAVFKEIADAVTTRDVIHKIERSIEMIKGANFKDIWSGSVIEVLGDNQDMGAAYRPESDHILLYKTWWNRKTGSLIHEIGHRLYYRYLDTGPRRRWNRVMEDAKVEIKQDHIEAYVDALRLHEDDDPGIKEMARRKEDAISEAPPEMQQAFDYIDTELGTYWILPPDASRRDYIEHGVQRLGGDEAYVDQISRYARTNLREAFAETFKQYVMSSFSLAPWTKQFFESVVYRHLR